MNANDFPTAPPERSTGAGAPAPIVTIAALFGTGGSVIAPKVAERLGVPFLDRAIPEAVAKRLGLPVSAVDTFDRPRSLTSRLFHRLARTSVPTSDQASVALDRQERRIRSEIEEFLVHSSRTGGVVLGRGGQVVLRYVPGALHVHLGGPWEARVHRAIEIVGVDRKTAERRIEVNDRARMEYVRSAYGVDGEDPYLYHLMLDATAFDIDTCVELIVAASRARSHIETITRPTPR